jgi:hypothetical protein
MLPAEVLDLLRQWWKARPTAYDAGLAPEQRWLSCVRQVQQFDHGAGDRVMNLLYQSRP